VGGIAFCGATEIIPDLNNWLQLVPFPVGVSTNTNTNTNTTIIYNVNLRFFSL
jgi:hypothetical protein